MVYLPISAKLKKLQVVWIKKLDFYKNKIFYIFIKLGYFYLYTSKWFTKYWT